MPSLPIDVPRAAAFMKTFGHEGRLALLCHLMNGEHSVRELEIALGARQAAVSQMLARLRDDGLVYARRSGKTIYYSLSNQNAATLLELVQELHPSPNQLDT
ncbi:transcriptional regulator, ArsR family [Epibacterium ulvae]|uniref:Transcriptional regulator, ArsR family n=2 Tax=Epibacterium ulvae TaxID=1156985 RepID=A0A1G5PN69_9RHOB|nr:transcriptional regulator, ArsR family [Epibacterium ulvae]